MRGPQTPPVPDAAGAASAAEWTQRHERSNLLAMRVMVWIALHLGRRVARWLLHPITLYFLCFAPAARRHSARYLARALGRAPTWADRYRHFHTFAAVVLDRVWFISDQPHAFDVTMTGHPDVVALLADGRGAILLGGHIGSFEALQGISHTLPGLRVAMVMYADNARMVQQVLQALSPRNELGIIPLGRSGSTLAIRDWLDGNGLVGILADRLPPTDAGRQAAPVPVNFLGHPAPFSDGPLRLALLLKRPVVVMVGLYRGGQRYDLRFEVIADFRNPPADAAQREQAVQVALAAYVERLERLCREEPYNWFNFYDYWQED